MSLETKQVQKTNFSNLGTRFCIIAFLIGVGLATFLIWEGLSYSLTHNLSTSAAGQIIIDPFTQVIIYLALGLIGLAFYSVLAIGIIGEFWR